MTQFIIVTAISLVMIEVITTTEPQKPPILELNIHREINGQQILIEPTDESYLPYDQWMERCYGRLQKAKENEKWTWMRSLMYYMKMIKQVDNKLDELIRKTDPEHGPRMELSEYEHFAEEEAAKFYKLREKSKVSRLFDISSVVFSCCETLRRNVRVYQKFVDSKKVVPDTHYK